MSTQCPASKLDHGEYNAGRQSHMYLCIHIFMNQTIADWQLPQRRPNTSIHNRVALDLRMGKQPKQQDTCIVEIVPKRQQNKWQSERQCIMVTLVPHISRMLCIDSWGAPTSKVRHPMPLAKIGPIVEPHSMSLRILNSCVGMPRLWASSLQVNVCICRSDDTSALLKQ